MAKTFLGKYKDWMETEQLPLMGLCNCLDSNLKLKRILVNHFEPTEKQARQLEEDGQARWFWGSGLEGCNENRYYSFAPMRQTIILLCAALNGEFD